MHHVSLYAGCLLSLAATTSFGASTAPAHAPAALSADQMPPEQLLRVHAPIGLDIGKQHRGGGSDGNFTGAMGIPAFSPTATASSVSTKAGEPPL